MVAEARNKRWQKMGNSNGNVSLERLAQHFEAFNRSEGKSPRTVEGYSRILKYFGAYLLEQGLPNHLEDLNILAVRDFVLYLQTKQRWHNHPNRTPGGNLTAQSVQSYVRSLRPFFSWLHRERYTEENILATLKPPRAPLKLVEILTDQ
jgi:integrase/recombinase XerD